MSSYGSEPESSDCPEPPTRPESAVTFSFEVFPPRSLYAALALGHVIQELAAVDPDFISVTYGASGSTRDSSLDLLRYIREHTSARPLGHLTCVGVTREELAAEIGSFFDTGIADFLAIRGDTPKSPRDLPPDAVTVDNTVQIIDLINEVHRERRGVPAGLRVAVGAFPGGHPASDSRRFSIDALLDKQEAGAAFAITQLFFEADEYLSFVDDASAAGVTIPIIPGIMPVVSAQQLSRVALLVGRRPPARLAHDIEYGDRDPRLVGIDAAVALSRAVLDGGAPALHLYTFNKSRSVLAVLAELGLIHPASQAPDVSVAAEDRAPGLTALTGSNASTNASTNASGLPRVAS